MVQFWSAINCIVVAKFGVLKTAILMESVSAVDILIFDSFVKEIEQCRIRISCQYVILDKIFF